MIAQKKQFELIPHTISGLAFKNPVPESKTMNGLSYEYYYNGGGVAIGDLNNDNLPDIFFTASVSPNKLYLNKGNLKFEDITKEAQIIDTPSWTTGVAMADVNADGLLDIYICRSGRLGEEQRTNKLFINQGINENNIPQFKEMSKEYGLADASYSTQSLFFDYDKDGDLDMFLLNHNVLTKRFEGFDRNKRADLIGDKLYRNDNGKFVDISHKAGINGNEIGYGLGVAAGDLNNDGWPDLYVSNDYDEYDYLYINNQDGTFSEKSKEQLKHISFYSMGVDVADYNNDGLLDIFSVDMVSEDNYRIKASMSGMNPERFWLAVESGFHHQYMFNSLQRNNGDGTFSEMAHLAGISNTDWSWAVLLNDLDNDGYKDLFITNGLKRDFRNNDFVRFKEKVILQNADKEIDQDSMYHRLTQFIPPRPAVNSIFLNKGDLSFKKMNKDWGLEVESFSNGASLADLDNDGDLDMVVNNMDSYAFLYKNNSNEISANNFLKVQLRGTKDNPFGIGTKLYLEYDGQLQYHEHYLTRGFQSSLDPTIHFGIGNNENLDKLKVVWPDGKVQIINDVKVNSTLKVNYVNSKNMGEHNPISKKLFADVSDKVHFSKKHKENKFNDFERETLLPHKMSEMGPAFASADVNGDGMDDIYFGASKDNAPSLHIQQEDGSFLMSVQPVFQAEKKYEDVSALFFDADGDNDMDLFVTSGGNEYAKGSKWYQDRLYVNNGEGNFSKFIELPNLTISSSCVKAVDFDGDGDLDLFVGGRQQPGEYPFPTSSVLLKNESTTETISFVDVTDTMISDLRDIGMVTDAVWTDFNRDSLTDLIVVGEWMGIKVFQQSKDGFEDISERTGIADETGWWYSIAAGDFDKDGDDDFIVGNLGLNYKYKATKKAPFEIYAKDFDENKTIDIVLGYHNENKLFPLRGRQCSSDQMPFIKKKFPNYDSFAKASLIEVYGGENLENALNYKANNFSTSYIENLGEGKFRVSSLDNEIQISCVNAIHVDDFDQDGNLDAFVAGNNYGVEVETIRSDASFGMMLRGNGKGTFDILQPNEIGVSVDGVVRHIVKIETKDKQKSLLGIAKNNAPLQFVELNR
ncbi:VCBS repeat-containing protein [Flagellimonas onchidii]|uniref:VCBS repeat-containing protein n=1 Tax=Flagellimonas onchidii TaxID=2562684 RepID=UPI001455FAA5|nr:VCBS repeat-containing protein [Allomuricauda onchidii]